MHNLVATNFNSFSRSVLSTGIDLSSLGYFYQMHFRCTENATEDFKPPVSCTEAVFVIHCLLLSQAGLTSYIMGQIMPLDEYA